MKNLKTLLYALIVLFTFSCQKHKSDIKDLVNQFADLECRAIALREQRFDLANQMRFTQDTLLLTTGKGDTTRLKVKLDSFS